MRHIKIFEAWKTPIDQSLLGLNDPSLINKDLVLKLAKKFEEENNPSAFRHLLSLVKKYKKELFEDPDFNISLGDIVSGNPEFDDAVYKLADWTEEDIKSAEWQYKETKKRLEDKEFWGDKLQKVYDLAKSEINSNFAEYIKKAGEEWIEKNIYSSPHKFH